MLSGLIRDVKRSERHEKPSQKKQRLQSERHRRRFQEEVGRVVVGLLTIDPEAGCSCHDDAGEEVGIGKGIALHGLLAWNGCDSD